MVHNGIEYGMMAAYAEGLNILKNANVGLHRREKNAETTPLRDPDAYKYQIDIGQVTEVWRRGSVVVSWLLDLTATALVEDSELTEFTGQVSDSGEGRWTIAAALDEAVPFLFLAPRSTNASARAVMRDFANRVLSAMRKQFGGHDEKKRRGS
jgi:6-phosphogluconate dehydrogenase